MNRKAVYEIMLTLLAMSMLTLVFNNQSAKASGTIYIRADGSIDPPTANITTADNVTYTFTDNINDSIVVERDNIVVDGADYTLEGTGSETGIDLSYRSNVTIKKTQIKKFYNCIYLYYSDYSIISGNNITANNGIGIYLYYSDYSIISGNNITANDWGIALERSSYNNISESIIKNSDWYGIYIFYSSNNVFRNNAVSGNRYNFLVGGSALSHYIHDVDDSNTVNGKPVYYLINQKNLVIGPSTYPDIGYLALVNSTNITVEGLELKNNGEGILFAYTTNSQITNNNVTNNYNGIFLLYSSNNLIYGNNITANNGCGIGLSYSSTNIICGNNITANKGHGIYLYKPSNNKFYHNNFVDNIPRAVYIFTPGYANVWDDGYPSGGNYWSTYTGVDANGDGIGDTPYVIDADNTDHYPLMSPWPDTTPPTISILSPQNTTYTTSSVPLTFTVNETTSWIGYSLDNQANVTIAGNTTLTGLAIGPHNIIVYANDTYGNMGSSDKVYFTRILNDVAVINVTASPTETYVNQIVNINVTVKNKGTVSETFNVTAYYDSNPIDTQSVADLAPGSSITLTFSWNTSGVQKGTYTISAEAEVVPGETNTTDNTYIDDTVTILNKPPTIDSFTPVDTTPEVDEGDSLGFTHTSSDPDDDALAYSWLLDSVEQSTNQNWTYLPGYDDAGTHNVTLVVSDGDLFDSQEWIVTVINVNRAPTAPVVDVTPDLPVTTDDLTCTVTSSSTDNDGDTVTYTYNWYKNGILQPAETTVTTALTDTVSSPKTAGGETWKCEVTPYDGEDYGPSDEDQVIVDLPNLVVDSVIVSDPRPPIRVLGCNLYANDTYSNGTAYYVLVEVSVENVGAAALSSFNVNLTVYWIDGSAQEDLAEWRVPSLLAGENTTLTYGWRPVHTGYYNLTAVTDCDNEIVESDEGDNSLVVSQFPVALMGDVNGDGVINIMDAVVICLAWGGTPGDPQWNLCADLNHDGVINIMDAVRVCIHWGQTW